MDIWIVIVGIVGSFASVVALFVAAPNSRAKMFHTVWAIGLIGSTYLAATYKTKIDHLADIERKAEALVADREMKFTDEAFILAALSFLEMHKAELPDTYDRAIQICRASNCLNPEPSQLHVHAAFALSGLLHGIGVMSSSR